MILYCRHGETFGHVTGVFSGWNVPEILIEGLNLTRGQLLGGVNIIKPSFTSADEELKTSQLLVLSRRVAPTCEFGSNEGVNKREGCFFHRVLVAPMTRLFVSHDDSLTADSLTDKCSP